MEESIDIVDKNGKPTGYTALKSEIHSKGYYHHTAHVWFYTKSGDILLAQRAASKAICPLLWDVSVAGHVDAGETIEQAAIRETKEEIGIHISENDLENIGKFECFQSYANNIIDNEFHNTFIAQINIKIKDLIPQKEEVEALKFVSVDTFRNLLMHSKTNNHFVTENTNYYNIVVKAIMTKITK